MESAAVNEVTRILSAIVQGDPSAASQLLPLVYYELRKLAAQRLAQQTPGQTLQPTALVHEAYLRLVAGPKGDDWDSRSYRILMALLWWSSLRPRRKNCRRPPIKTPKWTSFPIIPTLSAQSPETSAGRNAKPPDLHAEKSRRRRAVSVKGAVLVIQDGYLVYYRKLFSACGFEDNCRSTMLISTGITRSHFFCPKCRKSREVQIQGTMH